MARFIVGLLLLLVLEQAQSRPQPQCFKMSLAHLKTKYVDLLHQWNLTSKLEPGYMMFIDSDKKSLGQKPLAFVLPEGTARLLCFYQSVMLQISCPHSNHCYSVSLYAPSTTKKVDRGGRLFRRHARQDAPMSLALEQDSQHEGKASGPFSGIVVGVVGLVVLVLVLAMCGGRGDTFEPAAAAGAGKNRSSQSEVAEPAHEPPADTGPAAPGDTGPGVKDLSSNGNPASSNTVTAARVAVTSDEEEQRDSSEQRSNSSMRDVSERGRTLSARSHDPLPEVPKLEPASGEQGVDGMEGDNDDDDDPYAEVPGDNQDRMNESDSDDEVAGGARGGAEAIPPKDSYGKVSRHSKPVSQPKHQQQQQRQDDEEDSDSYAEVRDVMRRGPPFAQRDRSKTDPPNPPAMLNVRDKRALTESATHMPLPDIPGGIPPAVIAEENTMYDSIPESEVKKASPNLHPSSEGKRKERLYESVDEMDREEMGDRDLYESVPDTFSKVDSPVTPNTFSPSLSPTKLPPQMEMPPMPPSSPIPTNKLPEQQGKKEKDGGMKKSLSSAAQTEEKRRFSFFNRKKTSSISSGLKRGEQQPKSPTALISSTSPQHKPHPLHNLPVPPPPDEDEEEEDTYDKVTLSPGGDHGDQFKLPQPPPVDDVRSKSMSLPMAFRAGGRPNLPLPKLPEDSGSATVQHQRLMEGEGGVEYDTLQAATEQVEDEPNYDTVKADSILVPSAAAAKGRSGFDPPYDKISSEEVQALREREMQLRDTVHGETSNPLDSSGGYSKVRGEAPEGELDDGQRPEHDEEGYAVVPEEIKMRKRAFSASQTNKRPPGKELSPDSIAAGYHMVGHDESLEQQYDTIRDNRSQSLSVSPKKSPGGAASPGEDQYASIDMAAKHNKKKRELEEALRLQEELRGYTEDTPRGVSPIPPPLPPALPPDQLEEFAPPPIPTQSRDIQEVVEVDRREGLRAPSDSGDPPYAKVRSKMDNPYAEVNTSRPYAEVDILQTQPPPKAKSSAKVEAAATPLGDEDPLDRYDVIGTVGVRTRVVSGGSDGEEKPYDTIQEVMTEVKSAPSQIEQDTPKLDTVEESGGNIYNTLLPDGEVHGTDDEEEEEVKYEEIDKIPRSMV